MSNKKTDGKKITSLKELRAALAEPLICRFQIDERDVEVQVRRATHAIDEQRRALVRTVIPPFVRERGEYDHLNATYRAAREEAEDKARSVIVYHCCPEVAAEKPGLLDAGEIHGFVKNFLPPQVLEMIALTALAGGLSAEVNKRANFTSTPDSEN